MNNTVEHIKATRYKIAKLERDFKRGVPKFHGFTLDVFYGGNKEVDIERISIGSISDEEEVSQIFYNLMISSLKNTLKFWEDVAQRELTELTICLAQKENQDGKKL